MDKIYLVLRSNFEGSGYSIHGAFSSEEKAQKYIDDAKKICIDNKWLEIEEFDIDD